MYSTCHFYIFTCKLVLKRACTYGFVLRSWKITANRRKYTRNDLSLTSEWAETETDTQMIAGDDEELFSATSFQAASKVYEQWISDGQHDHYQRSHQDNISHAVILPLILLHHHRQWNKMMPIF